MSAERKYTDRDVRENDHLAERAIEFVEEYQGDFEFLVDCKMRLAHGGDLSVGMVRGILNCMRANPRVKDLPEPLPPHEGTVTPINNARYASGRRRKKAGYPECDVTEFHGAHDVLPGDYQYRGHCPGKYEINRPYEITTRAWVKRPFVAAVSLTSMVHRTQEAYLDDASVVRWQTVQHGYGFYKCDLLVAPLCTKPQKIKNPILLTQEEFLEMQMNEETARLRCPRCFS